MMEDKPIERQYIELGPDSNDLLGALGKIGVLHPEFVMPDDPYSQQRILNAGLTILSAVGTFPESEGANRKVQILPWAVKSTLAREVKENTHTVNELTPIGANFIRRLLDVDVLPDSATRLVGVHFAAYRVMPTLAQEKGMRHITAERHAQILLMLLGQSSQSIDLALNLGSRDPGKAASNCRKTIINTAHRVLTKRELFDMYDSAVLEVAKN